MRKNKEPTLFRKIIEIHFEQAKRRKALRILEKQAWSIDFLSLLLVKAAKGINKGLAIDIIDKNGVKITLSYNKALMSTYNEYFDDNIFNNLDDSTAVDTFIAQHSRRK